MRGDVVRELSGFGEFTPRPFPIDLRRVGALATRLQAAEGSISQAACTWFKEHDIRIDITDEHGDALRTDDLPSAQGRGTILAGRHRKGTEAVFLAAALGGVGVEMSIFAKPPSMQAQGVAALAEKIAESDEAAATWAAQGILPLITTGVAKDRPLAKPIQKLLWWASMRKGLPAAEAVRASNEASSAIAAERLGAGEAILMFPQGQIRWAKRQWQPGIGRLLHALTPAQRENTDVQFFDIQNYPSYRYVATMLADAPPPADPVHVRLSPAYPAETFMNVAENGPHAVTRLLQDSFEWHLGDAHE